jgi:hypothetical protein
MKRVSDRFLQLGVVFAAVGMLLGVIMGKTEDFTLAPLHAHINLLGWASMLIYGLVYRVVPKAATGVLPTIHFWLVIASFLVMIPSLYLYLTGNHSQPVQLALGISSSGMWLSMLLFVVIVWRATWSAEGASAGAQKAA